MLDQKTIDILNYRINMEQTSSKLYECMQLWVDNKGLKNFAKLYEKFYKEELNHADFSKEFLLSYGITPTLKAIPQQQTEYESLQEIIDMTMLHEIDVTRQCEELQTFALKSNLPTLQTLALKYCTEQVEELDRSRNIQDHSKLTSDLLLLDIYVGEHYL